MELHRDIRMLSLMHYRMTSGMALISHAMRCITPCIKLPPGISMDKCTMAGMKCWILHPERTEKGTLLMLHGGAFACPAASYHLKNASAYAGTGFRVIMPDYPLLPQHPHPEALEKACVPELYATDRVMEKVIAGGNFRDSYKDVGLNLDKVDGEDPVSSLKKRTSIGTSGNLGLEKDKAWKDSLLLEIEEHLAVLTDVYQGLIPEIERVVL